MALDVNWIDPEMCTPQYACLGTMRFKMSNSEAVTRATAKEVAKWTLSMLKEFNLVPPEQLSTDIALFVRAACTDNASAEVKAVVSELCVKHQPCIAHSFSLVVGNAVSPSIPKATADAHALAVQAALAAGEPAPPPLESRLALIVDLLASYAKFNKKGKGMASFFAKQREEGVVSPLALVARSATRWSFVFAMFVRIIKLRHFVDFLSTMTGKGELSPMDWAIITQTAAFLAVFATAITQLQSRTMVIGAHVGIVADLVDRMLAPASLEGGIRILPYGITPSVADINDRKWKLFNAATIVPADQNLVPETRSFLRRMQESLKWRMGIGAQSKLQLNSDVTMQAVAFDPGLKFMVLEDLDAGSWMFTAARKVALNSLMLNVGKALEAEMFGSTEEEEEEEEDDAPAAKEPRIDARRAFMAARLKAKQASDAAARGRTGAGARALPTDASSAFVKEWNAWKVYPLSDIDISAFWASDVAKTTFPILRRLFLSFCSTRPDNAEVERHFSALALLLAPLRRGRMKAETIERKMFLVLNKHLWRPLSDVAEDDPHYVALAIAAGLMRAPDAPATAPLARTLDVYDDGSDDDA
jgi:hypothetical protein